MYLFGVVRHLFNYFCRCLIKERYSNILFRSYYKQWLCRTLTIFPPSTINPINQPSFRIIWLSQLHQAHSLHFITGQSYKMAFYPTSSIQINFESMKSNISLHYKLIVENPSSFCQPLFRRQQCSCNSRQTTRRDNNLCFKK